MGLTQFKFSGLGTLNGATLAGSDTSTSFTYGAGLLVTFTPSDSLSIDIGYRYLVNEEPNFIGVALGNSDAHVLQVGVGWKW